MGRLTLNVLLSFAQFEREVTGERIRDKIAASKRKGMWMGGPVPLGYDVFDRKLIVNDFEAEQVRHIMERYLALGSVRSLADELATIGYRTKLRPLRNGTSLGGVPFSRGGLFHLLANCVYTGEVRHKGQTYAGAHNPIVERDLWERVQLALADKAPARQRRANIQHPSLLAGLVYDGHGRPMTPSHAVKHAKRYRYYITPKAGAGSPAAWRVPAHDLEQLVIARLCRYLIEARVADERSLGESEDDEICATHRAQQMADAPEAEQAKLIAELVGRVDIYRDRLELSLRVSDDEQPNVLTTSATLIRSGRQTRLVPAGPKPGQRSNPDEGLVRLVANAHAARLAVAESGDRALGDVASKHGFSLHYFSQLSRLGGLAPDIVTAILKGRQPAALTRTRLARTKALPLDWNEQRRMFGFA
jgi:hypothetical protein